MCGYTTNKTYIIQVAPSYKDVMLRAALSPKHLVIGNSTIITGENEILRHFRKAFSGSE